MTLKANGSEVTPNAEEITETTEPEENTPAEVKTYTDEEVDEIVKKKRAAWEKQRKKDVDEARKMAQMTEQERTEHEYAKLKEEVEQLREEKARHEMSQTARSILQEKGISIPDSLLRLLVTTEADSTKENLDAFATLFETALQKALNERLRGNTPKRMREASTMTREEILRIPDAEARRKAIQEHLELFQQ